MESPNVIGGGRSIRQAGDVGNEPRLRVLAVDDEAENLALIRRVLGGLCDLSTIESPLEAQLTLQSCTFDVLVTDQAMPNINGVSVAGIAKAQNASIVVIMVSAFVTTAPVMEAFHDGLVDLLLEKPWRPSDLRENFRKAELMTAMRRRAHPTSRSRR